MRTRKRRVRVAGRKPCYPIEKWMHFPKDEEMVLVRGKDFDCQPDSLRKTLTRRFAKDGTPIRVHVDAKHQAVILTWEK